jgi:hypothetical protein
MGLRVVALGRAQQGLLRALATLLLLLLLKDPPDSTMTN